MNTLQNRQTAAVQGSISDVAEKNGIPFAEAFLDCEAVVAVDVSGSMAERDAPGGRSRYDAARDQLAALQKDMPGRIAIVSFSEAVRFCPGGLPAGVKTYTDLAKALRFLKDFDGAGIRIVIVSDGEPDEAAAAMAEARTFTSRIDTVYVGPENGPGRQFLADLSAATGGVSVNQKTTELHLLGNSVKLLLNA